MSQHQARIGIGQTQPSIALGNSCPLHATWALGDSCPLHAAWALGKSCLLRICLLTHPTHPTHPLIGCRPTMKLEDIPIKKCPQKQNLEYSDLVCIAGASHVIKTALNHIGSDLECP